MKAIVVGATSGIGREVALLLARRGWQVGVAGRRESLLAELMGAEPNIIASQVIDVDSPSATDELHRLISNMGGIDLYFHSSGIGWQNIALDEERELRTVTTNAVGFTRMVDAAYSYFKGRGKGHIAVISSIAGTKGLGAAPAYSATKAFQNTYIESLSQLSRMENHGVRLTDIRPGFVRTALLAGDKYPLQLSPESVARTIVRAIERKPSWFFPRRSVVVTIDWRYHLIVFFWRLVPRWLWVRMPIKP